MCSSNRQPFVGQPLAFFGPSCPWIGHVSAQVFLVCASSTRSLQIADRSQWCLPCCSDVRTGRRWTVADVSLSYPGSKKRANELSAQHAGNYPGLIMQSFSSLNFGSFFDNRVPLYGCIVIEAPRRSLHLLQLSLELPWTFHGFLGGAAQSTGSTLGCLKPAQAGCHFTFRLFLWQH